ncbi:hypothetical protein B0I35DRAFT_464921 [Stachybotrys elegans]|uniref:Uncharacterized protein n=1 Tax=Stachybotrys elegans TaxID=80388 RepID=A0A8K0SDQ8_9HYPO|nr:hypothetical protein B0I35DRAFT_464921 [Stachybotrys elegans]
MTGMDAVEAKIRHSAPTRNCNRYHRNARDGISLNQHFLYSTPAQSIQYQEEHSFTHRSALICIRDNNSENIHVDQGDVIGAINSIHDECGSEGAKYQLTGDSGLYVDMVIGGAVEQG